MRLIGSEIGWQPVVSRWPPLAPVAPRWPLVGSPPIHMSSGVCVDTQVQNRLPTVGPRWLPSAPVGFRLRVLIPDSRFQIQIPDSRFRFQIPDSNSGFQFPIYDSRSFQFQIPGSESRSQIPD